MQKRIQAIVDRCQRGERLRKALSLNEAGKTEITFWFDPSQKRCGPKSAAAAIKSGLLVPAGDGLLGPESSQTWTAA